MEEWVSDLKYSNKHFPLRKIQRKRLAKNELSLGNMGNKSNSQTYMLLKSQDKKRMIMGRRKYLQTMTNDPVWWKPRGQEAQWSQTGYSFSTQLSNSFNICWVLIHSIFIEYFLRWVRGTIQLNITQSPPYLL